MGQKTVLPPSDSFIRELRSALNHLYDPDSLRQNPLADVFGVSNRFDTPSALQNLLTRAIESLKPVLGAANKAHMQAIYDLLLYRYVQQLNQDEIANQLGISVRHLRRQQNLAIYELARQLWEQYHLDKGQGPAQPGGPTETGVSDTPQPTGTGDVMKEDSDLSEELSWLKNASHQTTTDLSLALPEALTLIQPMAEQKNTRILRKEAITGLVQAHPVAFQQVVLNLLSIAIQLARGGTVYLDSQEASGQSTLQISGEVDDPLAMPVAEEQNWLGAVRKLIEMSHGSFDFRIDANRFLAQVSFHHVDPVMVLVVDDNPEIITMMQRFAAETMFQIIGTNDPKTAVDQALQVQPDLIVLDIMMPQLDGLQVLSRIKHHPLLGRVPVVVCSVLPQKDLAASLGANGFLQKPFQRDAFITTLNNAHLQKSNAVKTDF